MSDKLLDFLNVERQNPPKLESKERIIHFKEIYGNYNQPEASEQANRCLDCGNPYCEWKCPVHNYIPNWLKLVQQGKIMEAVELCHQTNSLPEICGRICPQDRLCEGACTINDDFGAVTIGSIEKYIVDTAVDQGWLPDLSQVTKTNFKVAIVGAGPAGLACADRLTRNGIAATVFDSYDDIGGLMLYGIPYFKLDKSVLDRRRRIFEHQGINFICNTTVGCDSNADVSFQSLLKDFDAVFIGTGAYNPITGNLNGSSAKKVELALPFLTASTKLQQDKKLTKAEKLLLSCKNENVVVLGGGDTAMDCVRSAVRLNAKTVSCVYRRNEKNMPGSKREVLNAKQEGVSFVWNSQPQEIKINKNEQAAQVSVAKTEIKEKNRSRSEFSIDLNNVNDIPASKVLIAFGYTPISHPWFEELGIRTQTTTNRVVPTGTLPYQTSNHKIFSGGDMMRGADLVVTAVADGMQAATSIARYLQAQQ